MKTVFIIYFGIAGFIANAQNPVYTTGNAHSHNDYEQARPFWSAYNARFGSIEADIFLVKDTLFVAHDTAELMFKRSFEKLYLAALADCIDKNKGSVYADPSKHLQLLIDIKTDAKSTLSKLLQVLHKYPSLTKCPRLHFAISGNRPPQHLFTRYPAFIKFDGELNQSYSAAARAKIIMLSTDFKTLSLWDGKENLTRVEAAAIRRAIEKAHRSGKKVRFWNAPDTPDAWEKFIGLGVDFINTDKIDSLAEFLNHRNLRVSPP